MNFHDGTLYQQREPVLHQRMEEQIDTFAPDVLVYPCRQDFHPDHSTTARIIDGILESRQTKMRTLQYLVHYGWYYPRPKRLDPNLYLLPPARLIRFGNNWQKLLLPEPIEGLKQEAIYSYQSQLRDSVLTKLLLSNIRKNELLMVR
jgi:LmbE family N-acetylglucosaminyl deacetylase